MFWYILLWDLTTSLAGIHLFIVGFTFLFWGGAYLGIVIWAWIGVVVVGVGEEKEVVVVAIPEAYLGI